ANDAIVSGDGERLVIGSEVKRILHVLRPSNLALRFKLRPGLDDGVELDDARLRRLAAGDGQALTIARKRDRRHAARLPIDARNDLALRRIDDDDLAMQSGSEELAVRVISESRDRCRRSGESRGGEEEEREGELAEH